MVVDPHPLVGTAMLCDAARHGWMMWSDGLKDCRPKSGGWLPFFAILGKCSIQLEWFLHMIYGDENTDWW